MRAPMMKLCQTKKEALQGSSSQYVADSSATKPLELWEPG